MISITRERLLTIQQWRETYGPGSNVVLPAEEAEELARVALASLEAEPVYQFWNVKTHEWVGCDKATHDSFAYSQRRVLYTTPPAPVSVPDAMDDQGGVCCEVSYADGWNACRAAMLQGADGNSPAHSGCCPAQNCISPAQCGNLSVIPECSCHACRPVTFADSRFVVCPDCGNKRCPHANDHRNACTGSNEPGQEGSAYPAAPQQEA
ncbi:hypothetical protein [Enterobacter cloacae]|uniref:hypothetical protein n=1 Tax=Enterobacter cloacae TaxID=550 RepID=UPI001EE5DD68|nr:hypothetical protein [Enterobacter cloacae]UKW21936.1 hypothetical protein MBA36_09265 [Enterobacter cloacae]